MPKRAWTSCCTAAIDQHQCLLFIHGDRAEAFAFPPCLLDQPARRQLDPAIGLRVAGQGREICAKHFGDAAVDYRIVEETAGIGRLGRIGQLALANGDDRQRDVPSCR